MWGKRYYRLGTIRHFPRNSPNSIWVVPSVLRRWIRMVKKLRGERFEMPAGQINLKVDAFIDRTIYRVDMQFMIIAENGCTIHHRNISEIR